MTLDLGQHIHDAGVVIALADDLRLGINKTLGGGVEDCGTELTVRKSNAHNLDGGCCRVEYCHNHLEVNVISREVLDGAVFIRQAASQVALNAPSPLSLVIEFDSSS